MTETGMSPADIKAVLGNDKNDENGLFGNNSWIWIIVLFLFAFLGNGFGNNGNNGGNGGMTQPIIIDSGRSSGGVADNYVLATDFANIERKLDGINNGICDSTYEIANNLNGNFRTLDNAICNIGFQSAQNTNAIQSQLAECCCNTRAAIQENTTQGVMNTNALSRQLSDCCCSIEKMDMQTRFDNQAYNCNTLQAIDKLGDRIIDYMVNEKTQTLRDENQALRLAASQSAQNQYIINALRPYPTPAFTVAPPYQFTNCSGCACA